MDNEPIAVERNGLLFICSGNGSRSQMAVAFARYIGPAEISYFSAGASVVREPNAHAIRVMKEVGVDLLSSSSLAMDEIPLHTIATVISLCEPEECPPLPDGVHHLSWPLPDPFQPGCSEHELLMEIRQVRNQIRELVSRLF